MGNVYFKPADFVSHKPPPTLATCPRAAHPPPTLRVLILSLSWIPFLFPAALCHGHACFLSSVCSAVVAAWIHHRLAPAASQDLVAAVLHPVATVLHPHPSMPSSPRASLQHRRCRAAACFVAAPSPLRRRVLRHSIPSPLCCIPSPPCCIPASAFHPIPFSHSWISAAVLTDFCAPAARAPPSRNKSGACLQGECCSEAAGVAGVMELQRLVNWCCARAPPRRWWRCSEASPSAIGCCDGAPPHGSRCCSEASSSNPVDVALRWSTASRGGGAAVKLRRRPSGASMELRRGPPAPVLPWSTNTRWWRCSEASPATSGAALELAAPAWRQ